MWGPFLKEEYMDEKTSAVLGMLKGKCEPKAYMEAYLYANGWHHDEWSAGALMDMLEYKNGRPEDMGVTPRMAKDLVMAKAAEMGVSIDISEWDAYAEIASAMSAHWVTVNGELDNAVIVATEHLYGKHGRT